MSRRLKWLVAVCVCLIVVVTAASIQGWLRGESKLSPVAPVVDLSTHPIYSEYAFGGEEDNVIDIGTQPLWVPTSLITETMKRDKLLMKAMADQGLKIRFHSFLKGADVNFFLQRGDLEVGIGGDMPALSAAAVSQVLIASLIQLGFSSIVARQHMLIKDLKGQHIGYAFGSNAHHSLLQTLRSAGLREPDVRLVPLDVNEMPDALAKGKIDAFSAWEPTPTIALAKYEGLANIHKSITSGYLYFSRAFADQYSEAVHQIVAAELRAIIWMRLGKRNLLEASRWALKAGQKLSGRESVLTAEQYSSLAKKDLFGITSFLDIPDGDLEQGGRLFKEFEFLKRLGKIPDNVKWEKVKTSFDRTIIHEVGSDPKRYQLKTYAYSNGGS